MVSLDIEADTEGLRPVRNDVVANSIGAGLFGLASTSKGYCAASMERNGIALIAESKRAAARGLRLAASGKRVVACGITVCSYV